MGKCLFHQRTADGERCIFLPPEEWRIARNRLIQYCLKDGNGCPVLARYYSVRPRPEDKV